MPVWGRLKGGPGRALSGGGGPDGTGAYRSPTAYVGKDPHGAGQGRGLRGAGNLSTQEGQVALPAVDGFGAVLSGLRAGSSLVQSFEPNPTEDCFSEPRCGFREGICKCFRGVEQPEGQRWRCSAGTAG